MEKINLTELNPGGERTALILEGWATNTSLYIGLAETVAELGYRVFLPDLPGFGASPEPPEAWNCADYAAFVNRFLEDRGVERVTLIGHSHGGRVILKAIGESLLSAKTERVVLIGSAGIVREKTERQIRAAKRYRIAAKLLSVCPQLLEAYRRAKGSEDYRNASPIMRGTLVRCINEDLRQLLPNIAVPTLLLYGERDADTPPENGRLMASLIPDAGFVLVPHAGHYAHLDNPEFVNRVLRSFLLPPLTNNKTE
ncbi:MAG: alpha/beta hydrolase [Oscillospiraceae bacterium]|jgi:pimeloyl-ACP methyl ester carboxylesterase|nr:alpha/beta hydrolase [Oscillospiraceae bacterium]